MLLCTVSAFAGYFDD